MARKIFVGNYKGGVGKTTFTYNMGCILRQQGIRVLLIYLDPQSSLTEVCLTKENIVINDLKNEETFNEVVSLYTKAIREVVWDKLNFDKSKLIKDNELVKYIPSSFFYKEGGFDIQCLNLKRNAKDISIVKWFIENNNLNDEFDYIIFDCPPSNNIVTLSAFFASDYYIIPTIMDPVSIRGVAHYDKLLTQFFDKYFKAKRKLVSKTIKNEPKLLGVFESKTKGQSNSSQYREIIKKDFYLFNTIIYDYKEIADKLGAGYPSERNEYKKLVKEVIDRINKIEEGSNEENIG